MTRTIESYVLKRDEHFRPKLNSCLFGLLRNLNRLVNQYGVRIRCEVSEVETSDAVEIERAVIAEKHAKRRISRKNKKKNRGKEEVDYCSDDSDSEVLVPRRVHMIYDNDPENEQPLETRCSFRFVGKDINTRLAPLLNRNSTDKQKGRKLVSLDTTQRGMLDKNPFLQFIKVDGKRVVENSTDDTAIPIVPDLPVGVDIKPFYIGETELYINNNIITKEKPESNKVKRKHPRRQQYNINGVKKFKSEMTPSEIEYVFIEGKGEAVKFQTEVDMSERKKHKSNSDHESPLSCTNSEYFGLEEELEIVSPKPVPVDIPVESDVNDSSEHVESASSKPVESCSNNNKSVSDFHYESESESDF